MISRSVLVVDDDASIRDLVEMALTDEGYDVVLADHGEAALRLLGGFSPDIILLDMRMPVMDGWEFARRYRQLPGDHAPIVVLTAARDAEERAAQIAADAVLSKPFLLADLYRTVSEHARGR